jgi:hypothetical protein
VKLEISVENACENCYLLVCNHLVDNWRQMEEPLDSLSVAIGTVKGDISMLQHYNV